MRGLQNPILILKDTRCATAIPEDYGNSRMGSLAALSFSDRGCRESPEAALGFGVALQDSSESQNYRITTPWLLFGSGGFGAGSLGFRSITVGFGSDHCC